MPIRHLNDIKDPEERELRKAIRRKLEGISPWDFYDELGVFQRVWFVIKLLFGS